MICGSGRSQDIAGKLPVVGTAGNPGEDPGTIVLENLGAAGLGGGESKSVRGRRGGTGLDGDSIGIRAVLEGNGAGIAAGGAADGQSAGAAELEDVDPGGGSDQDLLVGAGVV